MIRKRNLRSSVSNKRLYESIMKDVARTVNKHLNEGHFLKQYDKSKTIDTQDLENQLNDKIKNKVINCNLTFDKENIQLNILNKLKEGIIGHIVETIVINALKDLNIGFKISIDKSNHSDVIINNKPCEIKAFNKEINAKTGTIEHGITLTAYQLKSEGNMMIFVQYSLNDNSIIIKDVFCRYPDQITYSKGKSDKGTIVKF
jgi:hypothetical protein